MERDAELICAEISKERSALTVIQSIIHSFSSCLSYDRSKASSKASSPHSAIQSFLLQMRASSPFFNLLAPEFYI